MSEKLRIDKWLWFARFAKTRTLAQQLALSGHVRLNREKVHSASQSVKVGDVLTMALGRGVKVVRIEALGMRRGPAREAQDLYTDLTPPAVQSAGQTMPPPQARSSHRPSKRERRQLVALKKE